MVVSGDIAANGAGQISLAQVLAPVRDAMDDFDREIRAKMTGQAPLLNIVCRYLLWQKGKRLRPMLVLLSAGAAGAITPNAVKAAASIELLHTATLVHDDVVDNAEARRGFPSINGLWRNKVSVLIGDFLLAQSLAAALEIRDFTVLDILTDATRRMSEGEILQVQKRRDLHITEADYRQVITGKTGALFSAACQDLSDRT